MAKILNPSLEEVQNFVKTQTENYEVEVSGVFFDIKNTENNQIISVGKDKEIEFIEEDILQIRIYIQGGLSIYLERERAKIHIVYF